MDSDPGIDPDNSLDCEKNEKLKSLRELAVVGGEHYASNFWVQVYGKHSFKGPDWNIAREMPPQIYNDPTRMDICVQWWQRLVNKVHHSLPTKCAFKPFIISEGKKGSAGASDIATAEEQVYDKCETFVDTEEGVDSVWAFTYDGPRFRFWAYDAAFRYLIPFFPYVQQWGDGDSYLDLKGNELLFETAIQLMVGMGRPNVQVFPTIARNHRLDQGNSVRLY